VIFEGHTPSILAVLYRVSASFHWQSPPLKSIPPKSCEITLKEGYTLACFDGAAASSGLNCGAGGFFKTHPNRTTSWFINCGLGTNSKAELLGLWTSLALASLWSLDQILVLGDSRIIIDWINRECALHSVHMEGWKDRTRQLSKQFRDIQFRHIPRIHNQQADALSKGALSEVVGRLSIFHSENGIIRPTTFLNLFQ